MRPQVAALGSRKIAISYPGKMGWFVLHDWGFYSVVSGFGDMTSNDCCLWVNHLFSWESDREVCSWILQRFWSSLGSVWLMWVEYPKFKNTHTHTHTHLIVRCTLHQIYHLNHFKVYNSVVLGYSHSPAISLHLAKLKLYPLNNDSLFPPAPSPRNHDVLFSWSLTTLKYLI